jgi:PKD repeat protein
LTATTNADSGRATTWTILLTTAGGAQNAPPVAEFSVGCAGMVCGFDGSLSADPGGSVVSYAWAFGDGTTGSGISPSHQYASAGTYQVSLTVTDNGGATDVVTHPVTVSAPGGAVSFVGKSSVGVNAGASGLVPMPAGVQAGDRLMLFASVPVTTPVASVPAGWSVVGSQVSGPLVSYVWSRAATAADVGGSVRVTVGVTTKIVAVVAAYRNAELGAWASRAEGVGSAHVTPVVSAPAGARVVSYWADKSSTTTGWVAPGSVQVRDVALTTGGGRVTSLLADAAGPAAAGPAGGLTATTNADSGRATTWTILLT